MQKPGIDNLLERCLVEEIQPEIVYIYPDFESFSGPFILRGHSREKDTYMLAARDGRVTFLKQIGITWEGTDIHLPAEVNLSSPWHSRDTINGYGLNFWGARDGKTDEELVFKGKMLDSVEYVGRFPGGSRVLPLLTKAKQEFGLLAPGCRSFHFVRGRSWDDIAALADDPKARDYVFNLSTKYDLPNNVNVHIDQLGLAGHGIIMIAGRASDGETAIPIAACFNPDSLEYTMRHISPLVHPKIFKNLPLKSVGFVDKELYVHTRDSLLKIDLPDHPFTACFSLY
ncbi:MAG: hypothetical protein ACE5FT_00140 [Candidatus Nanoarchaeia archaeon]